MTASRPAARPGRHFLQIPGPSNSPDRVLSAMSKPTMDHRGPEFGQFAKGFLRLEAPRDLAA